MKQIPFKLFFGSFWWPDGLQFPVWHRDLQNFFVNRQSMDIPEWVPLACQYLSHMTFFQKAFPFSLPICSSKNQCILRSSSVWIYRIFLSFLSIHCFSPSWFSLDSYCKIWHIFSFSFFSYTISYTLELFTISHTGCDSSVSCFLLA